MKKKELFFMKKFAIIHGELSNPIQKNTIKILSQFLLDYTLEYPACFKTGEEKLTDEFRPIYIGTKTNNEFINKNSLNTLTKSQEYAISIKNEKTIIEGFDDLGALYGAIDFYNKYIIKFEFPHDDRYCVNFFEENMPDFEYTSSPAVCERGIWTWGHVIYDYTDFIDNMMKLKMNTIIIWNDFVPVNAKEMVQYAHDCGIKIYWGFAWGWDTDCNLISIEDLKTKSREIFELYEKNYAHLGGDGIYFQSFTELKAETLGGKLIADAVTEFVNDTSKIFYEKYPHLEIQFGLHATSVKARLEYIEKTDKRIRIVWEDCGSFPFSYIPNDLETFEETLSLTKKIATLRGNQDKFGVVTKGLTKLSWFDFSHLDGPLYIGTSSKTMKANRVARKRKIWKYLQAYWLTNSDKVYEMIRAMANAKNGDLVITALVEDGMFEENIMFPVALFSEMLWDNKTEINQMINEVALRDYVEFA